MGGPVHQKATLFVMPLKKDYAFLQGQLVASLNTELGEYGLNKKDLPPNVNFFMNVPVTKQGGLTSRMVLVRQANMLSSELVWTYWFISNCPQLNNPCNGYDPTPVEARIIKEAYS